MFTLQRSTSQGWKALHNSGEELHYSHFTGHVFTNEKEVIPFFGDNF
jgi:hypothetical protein